MTKCKLLNPELNRAFFISPPELVSRKLLNEVRPILDKLAAISTNRDVEKFFHENTAILNYVSIVGGGVQFNLRKAKEIADELGFDFNSEAGKQSAVEALQIEMLASFPEFNKAMRSYNISLDPNDDAAWALAIELIHKTAVIGQEVDRTLLESKQDPTDEFWQIQDVNEIVRYVESFRGWVSK